MSRKIQQLIQAAENDRWPSADPGWGASRRASLQQEARGPDIKAAIQREVEAGWAIILMEDYLQVEEGVKQKRKEGPKTSRNIQTGGGCQNGPKFTCTMMVSSAFKGHRLI